MWARLRATRYAKTASACNQRPRDKFNYDFVRETESNRRREYRSVLNCNDVRMFCRANFPFRLFPALLRFLRPFRVSSVWHRLLSTSLLFYLLMKVFETSSIFCLLVYAQFREPKSLNGLNSSSICELMLSTRTPTGSFTTTSVV